jgi:hypothetical protein
MILAMSRASSSGSYAILAPFDRQIAASDPDAAPPAPISLDREVAPTSESTEVLLAVAGFGCGLLNGE